MKTTTEIHLDGPQALRDVWQALICRAEKGDATALEPLRRLLDEQPHIWRTHGELARDAEASWLQLAAGNNLVLRESLKRKMDELRAELTEDAASPLERLIVDQVVIAWLQASHGHTTCAQLLSAEPTSAHLALVQKRQESSQRRLLLAAKQLATIRKLLKPPLSLVGLALRPVPETPGKPTKPRNRAAKHNTGKPPNQHNRAATQRNGVLVPN